MTTLKDKIMAMCGGMCLLMLIAIFMAPSRPLVSALLFTTALQIFFSGLIISSLVITRKSRKYQRCFQVFLGCQVALANAIVILGRNPSDPSNLWLGLHPGTALLILGITLWPFVFVALWTIGFEKVIFPKDRQQEIAALNTSKQNP